jgi:hypothetical protein
MMNTRFALAFALSGVAVSAFGCEAAVKGAGCPCLAGWTCCAGVCSLDSTCGRSNDAARPDAFSGSSQNTESNPTEEPPADAGGGQQTASKRERQGPTATGRVPTPAVQNVSSPSSQQQPPDSGASDAGELDAAPSDAGPTDAGLWDAALHDAASPESWLLDSGLVDAPLASASRAEPVTCAAMMQETGALSGLHWVGVPGALQRVYCDARSGSELCTEVPAEHRGVTTDGSRLPFLMNSVLEGDLCKVWNVRAEGDQRPLDAFELFDASFKFLSVDPCPALGLGPVVAQSRRGTRTTGYRRSLGCPYGRNSGYSACGFDPVLDGTGLMKWSNECDGCRVNAGKFHELVLQGEIYTSFIPWDAAGEYFVWCGT